MTTAAQGRRGENLKFDWMRDPQTTFAVPVTASAANKTRNNKGTRCHASFESRRKWKLQLPNAGRVPILQFYFGAYNRVSP